MSCKQLKEKDIFFNHYASLCSTLTDISNLLRFFVQERIINISDVAEINAGTAIHEKVEKLLSHIAGPLETENGNTTGFYKMLTIMAKHGNQGTKDLAEKMRSEMTSFDSQVKHEG